MSINPKQIHCYKVHPIMVRVYPVFYFPFLYAVAAPNMRDVRMGQKGRGFQLKFWVGSCDPPNTFTTGKCHHSHYHYHRLVSIILFGFFHCHSYYIKVISILRQSGMTGYAWRKMSYIRGHEPRHLILSSIIIFKHLWQFFMSCENSY